VKDLRLWITSWPNGNALIVEVVEERVDMLDHYYIKLPNGGTDTTSAKFLFDLPPQIKPFEVEELQREIVKQKEATAKFLFELHEQMGNAAWLITFQSLHQVMGALQAEIAEHIKG